MNFFGKAKDTIILVLKGIAMGIGNAIPGVSGGTVAVVTKIFDRLMDAITPNVKKLIKNMPFLIPVGVGMVIGIFCTSLVLERLFDTYYVPTQLFFLGLIIGSVPTVFRESKKETPKLRPVNLIPFFIGAAFMVALLFLNEGKSLFTAGAPLMARDVILYVVMGFIGAASMIIPGVSGSMIMKVFGAYDAIISAVANLDIAVLAVFAAGALVGLFTAVKIIDILLKKFRQGTYCLILGLIMGSVAHIFPAGFKFNAQGIVGIILLLAGLAVPYLTELPSKKKN
ncbi:MAG: DUF368 domain-containing protein [Ruminococcus sp.]|nr:DUF368 domain-containing protein [Ruminococcus sp.]MCM1381567.1 DUF368 domain-containing protein [Muribaculaceae bacterium]MCM1479930.1 DUF368 domain-containing protein [Muribaculaceae bacterium]